VTLFRPCIDLHAGRVKQIVGSSLRDEGPGPTTNFVADEDAAAFAHVIMLGPGNEEAATAALAAWPGALQLGGGIDERSALRWLEAGAGKVIVTSWLFVEDRLSMERVEQLSRRVGRERLVIDLSCRAVAEGWRVATNRWQTLTHSEIGRPLFEQLSEYCCEFLVHAADVEGKCEGIDEDLVAVLGRECDIPCTYAGGARSIEDLARVRDLSAGRVHLTFGSALDIFGGSGVQYADCVAWNRREEGPG